MAKKVTSFKVVESKELAVDTSSAFNFESPRVEVNFNKECNKYEFIYPES